MQRSHISNLITCKLPTSRTLNYQWFTGTTLREPLRQHCAYPSSWLPLARSRDSVCTYRATTPYIEPHTGCICAQFTLSVQSTHIRGHSACGPTWWCVPLGIKKGADAPYFLWGIGSWGYLPLLCLSSMMSWSIVTCLIARSSVCCLSLLDDITCFTKFS